MQILTILLVIFVIILIVLLLTGGIRLVVDMVRWANDMNTLAQNQQRALEAAVATATAPVLAPTFEAADFMLEQDISDDAPGAFKVVILGAALFCLGVAPRSVLALVALPFGFVWLSGRGSGADWVADFGEE